MWTMKLGKTKYYSLLCLQCPLIAMFVHAVNLQWHAITMAAPLQMTESLAVDLMILHYQCTMHVHFHAAKVVHVKKKQAGRNSDNKEISSP